MSRSRGPAWSLSRAAPVGSSLLDEGESSFARVLALHDGRLELVLEIPGILGRPTHRGQHQTLDCSDRERSVGRDAPGHRECFVIHAIRRDDAIYEAEGKGSFR